MSMTPLEVERWEHAKAVLDEAFRRGFTNAKARIAGQPSLQAGDEPHDRWVIDVPRNDIVDGQGPSYAPVFEEHGRRAGFAKQRDTYESDCQVIEGPDHRLALFEGRVRWMVWLERQDIATPKK
jgi:hypothetical protein